MARSKLYKRTPSGEWRSTSLFTWIIRGALFEARSKCSMLCARKACASKTSKVVEACDKMIIFSSGIR